VATSAGIKKRVEALEAKAKPKMIETLADYVKWIANRKPGEKRPPMTPVMESFFDDFNEKVKAKEKKTC